MVPAAVFVELFQRLVKQIGKPITSDQYRTLTAKLEQAEKAKKAGNYRKSLKLLGEVIEANEKTSLADKARLLVAEISEKGKGALEAALAESDPTEAMLKLEQIRMTVLTAPRFLSRNWWA